MITSMTNRSALYTLMILAPLAWGGLFVFTYFVPPHTLLAFVALFVLLGVAFTCTFSPLAYFVTSPFLSSRKYQVTIRQVLRQGALLSLGIILNLILLALRSWSIFTAVVIFVAAVVVEVLSLARK
jgi:hypothetical protein